MAPQNEPRSLQDRSKIVLDRCFFILNVRFGSYLFWGRFWCRFGLPNGAPGVRVNWGYPPPWEIQGGPEIVLVRSFFGLAIRDHFFGLLGASWSRFGASLASFWGHFEISWACFGSSVALLGSFLRTPCSILGSHDPTPSTRRLINLQPVDSLFSYIALR